jgi:hypothetical protein
MLKRTSLLIISYSFALYSLSAHSLWEEIWSPEEVSNQINQYSEDALSKNKPLTKLDTFKNIPESKQISDDSNDGNTQQGDYIKQNTPPKSNPAPLKKDTDYAKDESIFKKINNSAKSIFDSIGMSNNVIKKQTQDVANKTSEVYKKVSNEINSEIKSLGCEFVYKKYITEKKTPKSYSPEHNWNNWSSFDIKLYEDLIFGCKD